MTSAMGQKIMSGGCHIWTGLSNGLQGIGINLPNPHSAHVFAIFIPDFRGDSSCWLFLNLLRDFDYYIPDLWPQDVRLQLAKYIDQMHSLV